METHSTKTQKKGSGTFSPAKGEAKRWAGQNNGAIIRKEVGELARKEKRFRTRHKGTVLKKSLRPAKKEKKGGCWRHRGTGQPTKKKQTILLSGGAHLRGKKKGDRLAGTTKFCGGERSRGDD